MTQHRPSPVVPGDGTVLDVIPLPEAGKVMMIVAHVMPAPAAEPEGGPRALRVDRASRRVWAGGREIGLTYQEFELLDHLTQHPGTVFSRADLVTALWPSAGAASRTVDVHVHRLRRKLGVQGEQVATVRRIGYVYRPREASLAANSRG